MEKKFLNLAQTFYYYTCEMGIVEKYEIKIKIRKYKHEFLTPRSYHC